MENVAVVTGAGRGLGKLIAQGLADKGFTVCVTDIDGDAAQSAAEQIGPERAWAMAQDVRDPDSHRRVAAASAERGAVAVWVNNAGVLRSAHAWEHSDDEVRLQVEVNTLGLMFGSRAAIDVMQRQGAGHIINIASISSIVPAPGLAVYAASKHAVLGFSISLQGDLHNAGIPIKVSSMCPDAIDTDMTRSVKHDRGAALLFSSGRLLTAESVARSVVDLVDNPRLVTVRPRVRGVLAHIFRPFPGTGLKVLAQFRKMGERNQRRQSRPA
ncbi:MAG TPA: SDR family NAD(P)-dependent oxidoreductase [Kofleriaceae bacterium]|nr:SDR family NAD(P)-dependent oxidoreductase [Kofleriaceae bacterium]